MGTLSIDCTMTFYEGLRLVGVGDTRLGKNEPWKITAAPILVAVIVDAVILDSIGDNWRKCYGEGCYAPIVGGEG